MLFTQLLIEHVNTQALANTSQFGDMVADLIDFLYLFVQVFGREEIAHVGIVARFSEAFNFKEALKSVPYLI